MRQIEVVLSHELVALVEEAINKYGPVALLVVYDDVSGGHVEKAF